MVWDFTEVGRIIIFIIVVGGNAQMISECISGIFNRDMLICCCRCSGVGV